MELLDAHLKADERVLWSCSAWPGLADFVLGKRVRVCAVFVALTLWAVALLPFSWWPAETVMEGWTRKAAFTLGGLGVLIGFVSEALLLRATRYFATTHRVGELHPKSSRWIFSLEEPDWGETRTSLEVTWPARSGEVLRMGKVLPDASVNLKFVIPRHEGDSLREITAARGDRGEPSPA